MLKIISIHPNSIAEEIGMQPGDKLISINNNKVRDQIDYNFYISEESIDILIQRGDEQIIFEIEKDYSDNIGIELPAMKLKSCGNNCIFCFTDQNPDGMRRALYFKDEDYRFSFLYGNYVTLTALKRTDLERIVEQKLSPLYISVHSTEESSRKKLLGLRKNDRLIDRIEYLVHGGIELHAQVVLCPEINDGSVLEKTIQDLKQYYPGLRSIAVVPVGLTRHRQNLYPLRLNTNKELEKIIQHTNKLRENFIVELGENFIYLADEFYLKTDISLPNADYYDDFYQIENGVGDLRKFIDSFNEHFIYMPKRIPVPKKVTWVTGILAADYLEKFILSKLKTIKNLDIELIPIRNDYFGESITVSGLLAGENIFDQLKNKKIGDIVLLPPRVLNHDGFFLDDWTVELLEKKLGRPCLVYYKPISDLIHTITHERKSA